MFARPVTCDRAIGEWLRQRPRELTKGVRIATKIAPPTADGVDGTPFDRAYIEKKLQTSLDRLGLESSPSTCPTSRPRRLPSKKQWKGSPR
jgi:aryl-alcohol dehydrogenase-like predicted oxidoreductase